MAEGGKQKGGGECVKVVVRVRPLFGKEIAENRMKIVDMDIKHNVAVLHKPSGGSKDDKDFTYDAVFDERHSQQQIFEDTALEIVESVMDGFNGTIFAYGQTGAGKSHTMTGPSGPDAKPEDQGLLPRCFQHIFRQIEMNSDPLKKYLVRGSYIEIYNEEIRDLLSKNPTERCELKDGSSGVYVKDLSAFVVTNVEEMDQVLANGLQKRSVASTNMNEGSSRSHSIFMITIEQCEVGNDGEGHIRVGKLNMVDLAGSERQSKTGATGDRLKEATKINLSLSALGNVISALVDGKSSHVPYRDSKLTRLLQDSLGGNTKTVMVANLGPADYNYDETLSTLRYATRAKSIKNKPRINEDPKDAMIREFQEEIMRLKAEMMSAPAGGEGEVNDADADDDDDDAQGQALPKPPPRIEKQVEYVEKIVEKVKTREVIVEQGLKPEDVAAMEAKLRQETEAARIKADAERQELAKRRDIAESEKKRLLEEINNQERAAVEEQQRQAELKSRLASMEEKMMVGKKMMEQAIVQEDELKKQQRRLKRQEEKEALLKEREEQQRLDNQELEKTLLSQEEQVQKLTQKLQKLWDKYQKAQQEMVDVQQFNQTEREEMLDMIRELRRELKLKTLIMESFVPHKEVQTTHDRAVWDAEEDEWNLQPIGIRQGERPVKPPSAFGLPRPTSEFARINRVMGDPNPRFMYDCIVMTDLDLPERTTEDFEVHPELGERIEKALLLALSPDEEETVTKASSDRVGGEDNGRPSTGKRRPASGRPSTGRKREGGEAPQAAFPQARGLVSRE